MTAKTAEKKRSPGAGKGARGAARLAAVQALYQVNLTGEAPRSVLQEFIEHRFRADGDAARPSAPPDLDMFRDLVLGVAARRADLDRLIEKSLAAGWRLDRLHKVLLALLLAGAYELVARPDVPTAVIINEYVEISHAFFDAAEAAFANAVLDKIARETRPGTGQVG